MEDCVKTEFERLVYPIKGLIVSEFDIIEESKGDVDGQKVKIGNHEWWLRMRKRFNETKGKIQLGVYPMCSFQTIGTKYLDKGYVVNVSTKSTIRLINHKSSSKTISLNLEQQYIQSPGYVFPKLVAYDDLLDDGYLEDDKLTVECFLTILYEPPPFSDLEKERPNVQDLKTIFDNQLTFPITGNIKEYIDVESVTEAETYTDAHLIANVPCQISYRKRKMNNVDWLAVYISLNSDDKSEWWGCEAQTKCCIKSQSQMVKSIFLYGSNPDFYSGSKNWNFSQLFKWKDLISTEKEFVKDGKLILEAHIQIQTKRGFDKKTGKGIDKTMRKLTDAVMKVDGKELYVSKQILAQQSAYFDRIFAADPDQTEFEVTNVNAFVFLQFLCLVYNSETSINESNLKSVVEVVDRFQAPECFERCDYIMKRKPLTRLMELLTLIDEYPLPESQRKLLQELHKNWTLKKVAASEEYKNLRAETKVTILEWKLPETLRTEEVESSDYKFNIDFEEESKHSDIKIIVDGFHYYASKRILANASGYFMREFYGPDATDATELELFDIRPLQFEKLLTHIYHPTRPVTSGNVDSLLLLAHQYSVPRLSRKCEEYLVLRSGMPLVDKFEYAGKYNLSFLMNYCLNIVENDKDEKKALMESPKYHRLPPTAYSEIGQREALKKTIRQ